MGCYPRPQRPPRAPSNNAPATMGPGACQAHTSPGPQPSVRCTLQGPVHSPHHQPENLCEAGTVASPPGGGPSPQHRTGSGQWGPTVEPCARGWPSEKGGFTAAPPRVTKCAHSPNTCRLVKRPAAGTAVPTWLSPGNHRVEVSTQATGGLSGSQPRETVCHCQAHTPDAHRRERRQPPHPHARLPRGRRQSSNE